MIPPPSSWILCFGIDCRFSALECSPDWAGVLLLVNRYVPLAVAILAPVLVNILTFHALMAPSGLPLALFVALLWIVIFIEVRPAFSGLFQSRFQSRA